jgi:pyrroloquinoline quinone biosynthesis protein E
VDFSGCRCQAFALTGDATNPDPVCTLTPLRSIIDEALELNGNRPEYVYRNVAKEVVEPGVS